MSAARTDRKVILEINNLSIAFKELMAVNQVSFSVFEGDITAIIGPNGAGKTTLSKLTTGLLKPLCGDIWFEQQKLNGMPPHIIASYGISQVFQDIKLFQNMTALENVMVGCHVWTRQGFLNSGFRTRNSRNEEDVIKDIAREKLSMVELENRADEYPENLSWGQQRLVGVARALAAGPKLLFLDEPYGGLRTNEIDRLSQLIVKLKNDGLTIIIVDHLLDCVMSVADRVLFMVDGKKVTEGTPAEIERHETVRQAYMGNLVSMNARKYNGK